jgi:hypothetical protein
MKEAASICVQFYDLTYENETASGCAEIEVMLANVRVAHFKLGCFHLGPRQPYFVTREEFAEIDRGETPISLQTIRTIDRVFFNFIKSLFRRASDLLNY